MLMLYVLGRLWSHWIMAPPLRLLSEGDRGDINHGLRAWECLCLSSLACGESLWGTVVAHTHTHKHLGLYESNNCSFVMLHVAEGQINSISRMREWWLLILDRKENKFRGKFHQSRFNDHSLLYLVSSVLSTWLPGSVTLMYFVVQRDRKWNCQRLV